ncbi:MAG: nitroreductase family protein [Lachnoclostridium sp.]|nr:nitroreductase family protein [Lachnoclostridium sp.]
MDIIEAMRERRSVRTFDGRPLDRDSWRELQQAAEEAESPFGAQVDIQLRRFDLRDGFRPGTYGVIRGAVDFFLVGFGDDERSALSAGYAFETIVLKAWQMGLGTCWIAGTFKRSDFGGMDDLKVVSPVGVADDMAFRERMMRLVMGSKNRKPFGTIFFNGDFNTPAEASGRFGRSLEMMRLAPSSTNSQPWRALVDGDRVHFYYLPKSRYALIDCGIGLCHFHLTEKHLGREGRFYTEGTPPPAADGMIYLMSYANI